MDSESHDIVPVNQACQGVIHKDVIAPTTASTPTTDVQKNINHTEQQSLENSKYDTIDQVDIKPLTGGKKMNYTIIFKNQQHKIIANSELDALKIMLNNRVFKKNYLVEIIKNKNTKSTFIIKANKKNKFVKVHLIKD